MVATGDISKETYAKVCGPYLTEVAEDTYNKGLDKANKLKDEHSQGLFDGFGLTDPVLKNLTDSINKANLGR